MERIRIGDVRLPADIEILTRGDGTEPRPTVPARPPCPGSSAGSCYCGLHVRLLAGRYPVFSGGAGSSAAITAITAAGAWTTERVSFGANATCTAVTSSVLGGLAVDLDPGIRLASFMYAPGRVGYRLERNGTPIHPEQVARK